MSKAENSQQKLFKKYFTIDEAESLLPSIEKILKRTIQTKEERKKLIVQIQN